MAKMCQDAHCVICRRYDYDVAMGNTACLPEWVRNSIPEPPKPVKRLKGKGQ